MDHVQWLIGGQDDEKISLSRRLHCSNNRTITRLQAGFKAFFDNVFRRPVLKAQVGKHMACAYNVLYQKGTGATKIAHPLGIFRSTVYKVIAERFLFYGYNC